MGLVSTEVGVQGHPFASAPFSSVFSPSTLALDFIFLIHYVEIGQMGAKGCSAVLPPPFCPAGVGVVVHSVSTSHAGM